MKKIAVLLASIVFMGLQVLHAQKQITGTVTSAEDGSTLPGVSVMVKGTQTGGVTDLDGVYQLNVTDDALVLVFSFVGMKEQEIPIQGRTVIDIVMEPELTELGTVIVIGYGTQTKESITGSVGVVEVAEVESATTPSVDKILQGNVSGVFVTSGSGAPGSFTEIQIRGVGSINAGTSPLYVIDGVQINSGDPSYQTTSENAMNSLNPNDIASISVLKDASAGAIYGSRAANGVVLITTKKGAAGKTKINVRTQFGFTSLSDKDYQMCNSMELLTLQREAVTNAGLDWQNPTIDGSPNPDYLPDSLANINTNWWDEVTRRGSFQKYELSASGGNEKTTFYASTEYFSQYGAIIDSRFERLSTRLNLTHKSSDKLNFNLNMAPSYTQKDWFYEGFAYESPILGAQTISPMKPVYLPDGSMNWDVPENGGANPVGIAKYTDKWNNTVRILTNTDIEYEFIPHFKVKTQASIDFAHLNEKDWRSAQSPYGASDPTEFSAIRNILWTNTNLLTYNNIFNGVHTVDALIATEALKKRNDFLYAAGLGTNDFNPYLNSVSSDQEVNELLDEYAQFSYFSRFAYSYNGKYYFNASIRRDGSSKFGANNKWANFWSVGTRWRISREDFMSNIAIIDDLTLRGSYGTTGNSEIYTADITELGYYKSLELYESKSYNNSSALMAFQLANPDLRWEKSTTFNVAVEFGLLKRITGTIEYYNKKTDDMLLDVPLSRTTGFTSILKNLGAMRNTGLEVLLSTDNFKGEFKWSTDLNFSLPKNEILDLGGKDSIIFNAPYSTRIRIIGQEVSQFYPFDYAGVNPANGMPMWYDKDGNLTFKQQEARSIVFGDPFADFMGSITNRLNYKGIDLSFMFYFVTGLNTMHQYRRYMEDDFQGPNTNKGRILLNRWQQPGDITDVPKPIKNNTSQGGSYGNSRLITNGEFIRLKDITLSYSLPENLVNKAKLSNVKVYARGTNLWTMHNSPGLDPEVDTDGVSSGNHPNTKTITFGLDIEL